MMIAIEYRTRSAIWDFFFQFIIFLFFFLFKIIMMIIIIYYLILLGPSHSQAAVESKGQPDLAI